MRATLFLLFLVSIGFNTISRINEYARRGAAAYRHEEYAEAIAAYKYLVHDLEVRDDQLQLNLAHSYYKAGQWPQAQEAYRLLANHRSPHLRAVAHLQLGNIATKQNRYRQALSLYKTALIAEPVNDAARYNYELLKKYLDLHPDTAKEEPAEKQPAREEEQAGADSLATPPPADELEPQPKKKPDTNGDMDEETEQPAPAPSGQQEQRAGARNQQDGLANPEGANERAQQSGKEPGDQEGLNPEGQADKSGRPRSSSAEGVSEADVRAQTRRERLQQMNMSPEKARLLLDAMRNAELQYIQQLPKKSAKAPDKSRPDW